jgi:uncharacterized protein
MKILLSGASGLIGSSLLPYLSSKGHILHTLVRRKPTEPHEIYWDPERAGPDTKAIEGYDAVVHLAGASIASARWTETQKAKIKESREKGTQLLVNALLQTSRPPRILVCASAIGYYGDRGTEVLNETSRPGTGFLPDVCQAWEAATRPAAERGIRVVNLRFGIVLSSKGGALAKMLFPFKMGVGGRIGSGAQVMSWISLDDVLGTIAFALGTESLQGPVNTVSPKPVTNQEFATMLGKVLKRPTVFPLPAFAARLALGEMADALLLSSANVEPKRLLDAGYHFQWADLETALHHLLHK